MPSVSVTVPTPDGTCPATLHTPDARGPRPAVIMYPDAAGARETFQAMAARLAGMGWAVLLPDVYYRHGDWKPFDAATVFTDPDERPRLMTMARSVSAEMAARDAEAFVEFLSGRDEVVSGPVGTTGYCMGGRMSLIVAGHLGERVGAAASFHGGRLAVEEDPDSPHHLADRVRATVHVAGAADDASFPPEQATLLEKAYTEAGVAHTIETYPAGHGFAVPDNATFDEQASERHWGAMQDLYAAAL